MGGSNSISNHAIYDYLLSSAMMAAPAISNGYCILIRFIVQVPTGLDTMISTCYHGSFLAVFHWSCISLNVSS